MRASVAWRHLFLPLHPPRKPYSDRTELAVPRVAQTRDDVGVLVQPLVDGAVTTRALRPLARNRLETSGAASTHTTMISAAPRSESSRTQCSSEPPVAIIGSSTIAYGRSGPRGSTRGRPGTGGLLVTGQPDEAHLGLGQQAAAASAMPSPARNTGTSSGGSAITAPSVTVSGVRT